MVKGKSEEDNRGVAEGSGWISPRGGGKGLIGREASQKRLGLFGGTFNPIHHGHLRGAEEIREALSLHEIVFVPAAIPPHKGIRGLVDADHRLEMVRRAISDNPFFRVSDIEVRREGKSYSIETIRAFRQNEGGAELFFILGLDAFLEIETWKDFQDLFSLSNFVVMVRLVGGEGTGPFSPPSTLGEAFRYDPGRKVWVHRSGHELHFRQITSLDISSTKVRGLIADGKSPRYLVPAEVATYVEEHGLYR